MLSIQGVKKRLGKELIIYPFQARLLKGVGCNLTVGPHAWSLKTKKPITLDGEGNEQGFTVNPGDTALVLTNETLALSKKIGGTLHSKVDRVSEGFSPISTTLDPGWIGPLLIAITNMGSEARRLKLGESFVTVVFNALDKAIDPPSGNKPGRTDRLIQLGIEIGPEANKWLNEEFRHNLTVLKNLINTEKPYEAIKPSFVKRHYKVILISIPFFIASCIIIWQHYKGVSSNNMYVLYSALIISLTAFITYVVNNKG